MSCSQAAAINSARRAGATPAERNSVRRATAALCARCSRIPLSTAQLVPELPAPQDLRSRTYPQAAPLRLAQRLRRLLALRILDEQAVMRIGRATRRISTPPERLVEEMVNLLRRTATLLQPV